MDIWGKKISDRVLKGWNRLPREVVKSSSWEMFRRDSNVVVTDMV